MSNTDSTTINFFDIITSNLELDNVKLCGIEVAPPFKTYNDSEYMFISKEDLPYPSDRIIQNILYSIYENIISKCVNSELEDVLLSIKTLCSYLNKDNNNVHFIYLFKNMYIRDSNKHVKLLDMFMKIIESIDKYIKIVKTDKVSNIEIYYKIATELHNIIVVCN
jgi:hypothetical protein